MTRPPLDFYLVPATSQLRPLCDEWLRSAERELGVALPRELVQLLRLQNGGQLRYDSHAADIGARDHVSIHNLRGIGPGGGDRRSAAHLAARLCSRTLLMRASAPRSPPVLPHFADAATARRRYLHARANTPAPHPSTEVL
jgi:hypothetical protein